jgi:tRNA (adenine57-N1/adenine58-N1)-methyltransferase
MQAEQQDTIKDNSYAVLFEKEDAPKLTQLIAGTKIQTSDGAAFRHLSFINSPWAVKVEAFNKPGKFQRAIKPKSTLITETLARKTQILYAMDNSAILFKLNLVPGSRVIEAGTGSGSLSCAIAETIQEQGHLFTFEFNQQRA